MTVQPGDETANELYPNVAAVAATYGDPDGKNAAFLANADKTYPAQPYFSPFRIAILWLPSQLLQAHRHQHPALHTVAR
jgi:hypothetical protein